METARIELKLLLATLGGVLGIEVLAVLFSSALRPDPILLTGMVRLSEVGLMVGAIEGLGPGLPALGLSRKGIAPGLARGGLWAAVFGVLAGGVGLVLLAAGHNPLDLVRSAVPQQTAKMMLFLMVGGLIGPVAEEFFFRGILYGFLRRWGFLPALILSTALFVGLHPTQGIPLPQLVGGVLFAAAYEWERNLLVPVTLHVLGNLALFSLSMAF